MKFKKLTNTQISRIQEVYNSNEGPWEKRAAMLGEEIGVSERTIRKWCSSKLGLKNKITKDPEVLDIAKVRKHDSNKKIFLVSWAQNATPVHRGLYKNMCAYAEAIDAEILIIPGRYHNPTSIFTKGDKDNEWWSKELIPHLTLNRHNLNRRISILSDVKIQPTCANPLQGLEGMTGEYTSIVGHPRFELRTVPTMEGCPPKFLFTTGCITQKNYTDSKAGHKGAFHHSLGFAIVEIKDDEVYFFRQVSANNKGEFIDLDNHVKEGVVEKENNIEACILGDIHVAHVNHDIIDLTLYQLFKQVRPNKVFLHDVMDSRSVSHHNLNDPFELHKQELEGVNCLQTEIDELIVFLQQFEHYETYIVKSNHDEHIDKFLRITDWRKMSTLKNALPYMEYATATLKGEAPNGIVPYVINKHYPKFKCLGHNDSVKVKDYLCSVHGHVGANGSRGSIMQYSKLSTKIITGHSHTISRIGGAASVGTSTHLRVGYNIGASAWVNAHGIINKLGKFQHIVIFETKDGYEYTTLK